MSLNTSPSFDFTYGFDEPVPYEGMWECYGGKSDEEIWDEIVEPEFGEEPEFPIDPDYDPTNPVSIVFDCNSHNSWILRIDQPVSEEHLAAFIKDRTAKGYRMWISMDDGYSHLYFFGSIWTFCSYQNIFYSK